MIGFDHNCDKVRATIAPICKGGPIPGPDEIAETDSRTMLRNSTRKRTEKLKIQKYSMLEKFGKHSLLQCTML